MTAIQWIMLVVMKFVPFGLFSAAVVSAVSLYICFDRAGVLWGFLSFAAAGGVAAFLLPEGLLYILLFAPHIIVCNFTKDFFYTACFRKNTPPHNSKSGKNPETIKQEEVTAENVSPDGAKAKNAGMDEYFPISEKTGKEFFDATPNRCKPHIVFLVLRIVAVLAVFNLSLFGIYSLAGTILSNIALLSGLSETYWSLALVLSAAFLLYDFVFNCAVNYIVRTINKAAKR